MRLDHKGIGAAVSARERTPTTAVADLDGGGLEVREAQRYLARYGYLSGVERAAADEGRLAESLEAGLRRFQRLHVTGTLTLETLKLMRQPRCPMPDFGVSTQASSASG
ncbi:peptidoglycan-binding protein [Pseudarthrobacter phenanthrenivorans]|uniref:Peptidoglycan-binding protein n=1 Tax=Pseudarthrobacter phenanthrenivorans TaxID=361575 RepID=A0A3B0FUF0_PSEPS|nr:peptidoglycan-binding protein [Pseudarthrobacter phenanthrenivorans]TPV52613.1 peptidoglycan-binding protein [Pseudarthrobacter phenanthrenivorans]